MGVIRWWIEKKKNWVTEGQARGVKKTLSTHGSGSTRNAAKEAVGCVELRDQHFRKARCLYLFVV
jgi:hypothetical protein